MENYSREAVGIDKKSAKKLVRNGFTVTALTENLPEKERRERDSAISQAAKRVLHEFYNRIDETDNKSNK